MLYESWPRKRRAMGLLDHACAWTSHISMVQGEYERKKMRTDM